MLERKRHTGWRKTKKLTVLNDVRLLFVLSQCVPCSTAWRFCTTWMTSCKETTGVPYVTRICNGCMSFGCGVVCIIHPHPNIVILYFYSSTCFKKKSGLQRDSNPWPPRYRCVALPTELWSHTLGARSIYWVHISREEGNDVKYMK